jgi:hypothetical protein
MDRQIAFIPNKNQNSQGGLVTLNSEKKEQDSRGGLKNGQDARFVSNRPIFAELNKQEIQAFQIIPDYDSSTVSPYPVIVKSPTSCHCVDGWDKVESSIAQNQSTLTCHVFYIPEFSETEIAIRKVAIRTMPLGGICSYTELVRNVSILFNMFLASAENPVVFFHGGARRGVNYTENKKNNVRILLANRLGKSVTTINKYLQHGKNLSEEVLQTLIRADVQKGFFEAIQKDKQRLIDDLKAEKKSKVEIFNAVSDRVISWFEETQTSDLTEIIIPQTNQHPPPATEIQPQQNDVPPPSAKSRKLKHWSGNPSAALEKQPTEEEICQEFIAIGQLLIETAENKEMPIQKRLQKFSDQIFRQFRLIQHLKHQMEQQSINPEEQR